MKILVISDKFKFTFSSLEINSLIVKVLQELKFRNILQLPVSDGGEGFLDVIEFTNKNAKRIYHKSVNAVFEPIETYFLLENKTAYIECAKTCGLYQLPENKRNPLQTSTYGLGLQIKEAIKHEVEKIIIGLGGSATNDAGIGVMNALGVRFCDKYGNELKPTSSNLIKIYKIDVSEIFKDVYKTKIFCATDVTNVLYGKNGAAYVYAKQKGATDDEIKILDNGLKNYAKILSRYSKKPLDSRVGLGAAGGIPVSLFAFFDAKIISGAEFLFKFYNLEEKISDYDLIITGEGKFDKQSLQGKITGRILKLIKKYNKQGVVICGCSEVNTPENYTIIPLFNCGVGMKKAKAETYKILKSRLNNFFH